MGFSLFPLAFILMGAYCISHESLALVLEPFDVALIILSILGNNNCITYIHLGINLTSIYPIQSHFF